MIKLIDILREIESNKILVPRRSEERKEKHIDVINKKIQQYIKDGNKGDLNLSNTPITSLPDNLIKVGGYLHLSKTPITSLPDNLQVVGDLHLSYSKIASFPNNLKVKENLIIFGTSLSKKYSKEEIRKMIEDKGGYIKGEIIL